MLLSSVPSGVWLPAKWTTELKTPRQYGAGIPVAFYEVDVTEVLVGQA